MFIKNAWYVAHWSADLGTLPVARRICGEPIVIYRDTTGSAVALRDACCHRAAPVSAGRVVERGLECGYHGLVFDRSGLCIGREGKVGWPPQRRCDCAGVQTRREVDQDAGGRGRSGQRTFDPGGGHAGSADSEYRSGLGDAGRALEDESDADAIRGARLSGTRRHGPGRSRSRASLPSSKSTSNGWQRHPKSSRISLKVPRPKRPSSA
jgi:nitrite reductase/ring-hydroxylating ferredoxin subunit